MGRMGIRCAALVVTLAFVSIALVGCIGSKAPATATGGAPAVGDMVAAKWTDGNLYLAKVTAVADGKVTVTYQDDNSVGTVTIAETKAITVKQWTVGDKVLAVWSAGRFYPGTVEAATPPTYTIKWDDGSTPSEVDAAKIIAQ